MDPTTTCGTDGLASSSLPSDVGADVVEGFRGTAPGSPEGDATSEAFDKAYTAFDPTDVDRQTFDSQNFDAVILCYLAAVAAGSTDGADMADVVQDVSGPPGTSTRSSSSPTPSRRWRTATTSITRAHQVPSTWMRTAMRPPASTTSTSTRAGRSATSISSRSIQAQRADPVKPGRGQGAVTSSRRAGAETPRPSVVVGRLLGRGPWRSPLASGPALHGKRVFRSVASFVRNRWAYRPPIPDETALQGGRWQICDDIGRFSAVDTVVRTFANLELRSPVGAELLPLILAQRRRVPVLLTGMAGANVVVPWVLQPITRPVEAGCGRRTGEGALHL